MPSVNAATFMLTLSDKEARKKTIWTSLTRSGRGAGHDSGHPRFQIKENGSDVMASSRRRAAFGLREGADKIAELGRQVADICRKTPGDVPGGDELDMALPAYEVKVDRTRRRQWAVVRIRNLFCRMFGSARTPASPHAG